MTVSTKSPRISVVTTNKNGARTLDACIKAILSQTLKPIEVVIVDAGSIDASAEIAARYASNGVRFMTQFGCSPSEGEFLAEQEAKGDFIAVTNPDCYAMPDWLERAYEWWSKGYDVVGGVKINCGDIINFSWTAFPDNMPWETERPELGLTSMSTFTTKRLLMELPIKGIFESRDVELALMTKQRGLKLLIDPKIRTLHDDPLRTASNSFRKSASYATRHVKILKTLHGGVGFGGGTGIVLSFKQILSDFLLIDAVKTCILYKPILEQMGLKVNPVKFVALRGVFKLGQIYGVVRGMLSR